MKKNKIISLVCAVATALTTFCSFTLAHAGENSANMTEGIVLEKVDQGANYVTVDAYAKGFTTLKNFTVALTSEVGELSSIEVLNDVQSQGWNTPSTNVVKTMTPNFALAALSISGADEISVSDDNAVIRLKITYTADITETGKVSVHTKNSKLSSGSKSLGTQHEWKGSTSGVILDYITVAPLSTGEEEEPVVINAEYAGMFTYWQDAPVAQAFFANLTAEQAAKDSIVWTVTDGTPDKTKTEVANIDTEVSGESGVVLGLVVSNAVEGLTATVTVK
jgi:hypothetical protein